MSSKKRSHKLEKLARIYDDEILPVWGRPFARMLLRGLEIPEKSQVLDVACGTGYVTLEILERMGEGSRLIAIDGSSAMLDMARRKVERMGAKGVFFRTESAEPRLSFADDVYDLVVCNLGLAEMDNMAHAVADFARVTRPGGEVRCTLPLAGTFQEFFDIYREVLLKHDKHAALARLDEHLAGYPSVEDCDGWLLRAGLDNGRVELEEFTMLFKSSREFFFAPVIEYGSLPLWKAIAGQGQEMQDIFWYIKEAIDAYFGGRAFQITVKGGCLVGEKRAATDDEVTGRLMRSDLIESGERVGDTALMSEPALIESAMEELGEERGGDGTREIDIAEIEEIYPDDEIDAADDMRTIEDDAGLDAFLRGSERPAHRNED